MFPDYSLPDPTGMVRTLSELQGRDPLILLLARGNYCSKEHHQHLELAANYPKVAVAYTRIVTISTRRPSHDPGVPGLSRRRMDLPLRYRSVHSRRRRGS